MDIKQAIQDLENLQKNIEMYKRDLEDGFVRTDIVGVPSIVSTLLVAAPRLQLKLTKPD